MDQLVYKLIENLPIPAFIIKQNHKLSHWNKALENLVGLKADEVIGTKRHAEIFSKEEHQCMADLLMDGAIQNNINWSESGYLKARFAEEAYETTDYFPLMGINGTWLHLTAEVIRDSGGNVVGVIQYLEDMTKSKRTEDALQEIRKKLDRGNEQLQKLLDFMRRPDVVGSEITSFVIEECVKISESKIGFFGLVNDDETVMKAHLWSDQAMEMCAIDFKPLEFNIVTAGIWAESIRMHKLFVDNDFGKPDPRKKGYPMGHVPIQRYLSIPVIKNGKVIAVLGLANKNQDYTNDDIVHLSLFIENIVALFQKKETEIELQESEERYRTVFENTGTSMMVVEDDMTISLINAETEKLTGYSRGEVEGKKKWTEFVAKDDLERMEEYHRLRKIDPDGAPKAYEYKFINKQGAARDLSLFVSMIPGTKKSVASLLDITERKEAEEALLRTTAELQAVFHVLPDLYFRLSADGTFLQLLAGRPSDLYLPTEDLIGKRIQDVSKTLSEQFQQAIDQVLKTQSLVVIEYPMTLQGERRFFEARFLPLLDNQVIVVVRNITERKHLEDMLQLMSRSDGLTGIANRRLFDERLHSEWMRAARYSRPLSLIMCDVDYFKEYNDTYGHLLGDDCLKQVANVLHNAAKRASDLPARYGGDEFAVILPDIETEGAALLAEETRSGVEKLRIENNNSPFMNVTISAGVATLYPSPNASPVDLIAASDKALYAAKKNGHNRAELCSAS